PKSRSPPRYRLLSDKRPTPRTCSRPSACRRLPSRGSAVSRRSAFQKHPPPLSAPHSCPPSAPGLPPRFPDHRIPPGPLSTSGCLRRNLAIAIHTEPPSSRQLRPRISSGNCAPSRHRTQGNSYFRSCGLSGVSLILIIFELLG